MIPPTHPGYRQTSNLIHFVLFVISFGLWTPFWIIAAVITASHNSAQDRWYRDACDAYEAWRREEYMRVVRDYQRREQQAMEWRSRQARRAVRPAQPRRALPR